MKVGIDSYCFHRYFGDIYDNQTDPGVRWTVDDFIRFAVAEQVAGVSLETCFMPALDQSFMRELKDKLDEAKLERVLAWGHPDGLEGGRNEAALDEMIAHIESARTIGAKVMRFVGASLMFKDEPHQPQLEKLIPMIQKATKEAEKIGVTLAIENHIDYTADEILYLLQNVGSDYLKVNFDTANLLRVNDDPVEGARKLGKYTVATHTKDVTAAKGISPKSWMFWPSTPTGEGVVDMPGVVKALAEAGYEGVLAVELDNLAQPWISQPAAEEEAVRLSLRYLRKLLAEV